MPPSRRLFWEEAVAAEASFGPFVVEEAQVRQFEALVGTGEAAFDGRVRVPDLMLQSLVAGLVGEHQGYLEVIGLRAEVWKHEGCVYANEPFQVRTRTTPGEAIDKTRGTVRHDRAVVAADGRDLLTVEAHALIRRRPGGGD